MVNSKWMSLVINSLPAIHHLLILGDDAYGIDQPFDFLGSGVA